MVRQTNRGTQVLVESVERASVERISSVERVAEQTHRALHNRSKVMAVRAVAWSVATRLTQHRAGWVSRVRLSVPGERLVVEFHLLVSRLSTAILH